MCSTVEGDWTGSRRLPAAPVRIGGSAGLAFSGNRTFDQAVPGPLRLQDDLDDLADGAPAAGAPGDEVGGAADLGGGVGRAGGQADGPSTGRSARSSPT